MPLAASATPVVSSVSGTASHGQSLTITGSGFGAMGGHIISWDDFEAHALGSAIQNSSPITGPTWTTQNNDPAGGAGYSNIHAHSGNVAAHINWSGTTGIRAFGWAGQGPFNKLYITYWRWMEGNYSADTTICKTSDGYACNHKQFYLFGNSGGMPQGMPLIPAGNTVWGYYNNVSAIQGDWNSTNNINKIGLNYSNTSNKWSRWEFWQTLNSDPNCANGSNCDGILQYWVDAKLAYSRSDYKPRFVNGQWIDFRLGHMAHGFTNTAKAWFDDLYIANTLARVELGDNAAWDNCTHREIQIVSSWTDSQIQAEIRQENFPAGTTAYLFIVDANGNPSPGYPVTFSDTTSPAAPKPPKGLTIKP
ncbi:MAG TPA: hypothetical protein DEB40_05065 [Elusimicrobia bacterium]|nr:hypothetical protein [Elusimicrobiota bacterium]HBT61094.1 hypothetical protein [Elusimicrobiota bacterium]